jgi:hypothetical protein
VTPYFRKVSLIVATLGLLVSLFFALTSDGEDPVPTTTVATQPTTASPPRVEAEPAPVVIDIDAGRGEIVRRAVDRGDRVVLDVTADVADRVHVHGYDLFGDVAPGKPAKIAFDAETTGRFEIELEERHVLIAELEVRP